MIRSIPAERGIANNNHYNPFRSKSTIRSAYIALLPIYTVGPPLGGIPDFPIPNPCPNTSPPSRSALISALPLPDLCLSSSTSPVRESVAFLLFDPAVPVAVAPVPVSAGSSDVAVVTDALVAVVSLRFFGEKTDPARSRIREMPKGLEVEPDIGLRGEERLGSRRLPRRWDDT